MAISPEESFCNTIPTINLNDYKVTTKPGSWFIESGPVGSTATITGGNMFVGTGSPYGQYVLYYKLDAAAPIGCFDTAQLILTLDSTAFAGANDVYDRCVLIFGKQCGSGYGTESAAAGRYVVVYRRAEYRICIQCDDGSIGF
ncbi:MAG: hypothetical protein IPN87_12580 [Saprospiraceae bacterium]|nr:hypothetical protein [Candidatus Brachybacter algidus]